MKLVVKVLASGAAVFVTAYLLPGVMVDTFVTALIVAVALGVVNTFIKPILSLLTFPINFVTLGIFGLVLNAALIYLVSQYIDGFSIENLLWAIGFGIVLGLVSGFLNSVTD